MKLPKLPGLEGDFKDATLRIVCERVHLCIDHVDALSLNWRNEMDAVFDVLPALSAKHHGRDDLAQPYTVQVFGDGRFLFLGRL